MEKIILYGTDGDEMKMVMIRAFSPFRAIRYYRNGIFSGTFGYGRLPLTLMDYTCPFIMEEEPCLFIFKKNAVSFGGIKLPASYFPILESDNAGAAGMLAHTGVTAVTCGMSPRDTLSLSSNDFPVSLVSIQRDLLTPDDRIIEPADIPVSLSAPAPEHPLLAACAALLLCGDMDEKGLRC